MAFYGSTSYTRTSDLESNNDGHNIDEINRSMPLLQQQQRDQNLLFTITQEIKKSVNESLEGVVGDLRKQVMDLQSEVVSLQQSSTGGRSAFKRPRLPKVLTVRVYIYASTEHILHH